MEALLRHAVDARDRAVKSHAVTRRRLGPDKGHERRRRIRRTKEPKETRLLKVPCLVATDAHVIDDRVDVGVEQRVDRKRRRLHLSRRKGLEFARRCAVGHGDLDAMRVLIGFLHRELRRILRESATPLDAHVECRDHRAHARILGKRRGRHAAHVTPADLHDHDRGQEDRDECDG